MKLRDSGMPGEAFWESLFDVDLILSRLRIDSGTRNAAELGCGFGTFTVPVARSIGGTLFTFDIEPEMVARTRRRAQEAGVRDIVAEQRDVYAAGFGLATASQDACLLFNILHGEEPVRILTEAARVVRPGGVVYVVHWRHDPATPRGPDLSIRPRPEQVADWARQTGALEPEAGHLDLPPWHYGLRLLRY